MQEPRQLYGLGSLVKKITKPIKKIVKSPIGKAALGAAAIYGLGGGFGAGGFKAGNIPGIGRFFSRGRNLGTMMTGKAPTGILSRILGGAKKGFSGLSGGQQAFLLGGAGLSLLPFLTGGAEEEEIVTADDGFDVTPSSIANIRQMARNRDSSLAFLPQQQFVQPGFYAAEGGRAKLAGGGGRIQQLITLMRDAMDKGDMDTADTIRADIFKEFGLRMNKGGIASLPKVRMLEGGMPEIDYRESGGFVPVGKKEKADDVPAMLSKNEFVMTADAVRGMGDGNVEKGAQKMYDQMRELESRVV
jgi:hypothetical protein